MNPWSYIVRCPGRVWTQQSPNILGIWWRLLVVCEQKNVLEQVANVNESPVVATKSQLLKSSSVEGIRKDMSGGQYMWMTRSREQGEEPLVPFVIAREKTLPRWSSWGASYQKESIHLEKHDILIRFLKIFEPCVVWVCLNVLEAVGSFLDFDTKPSYIQLHLPSFWIWYCNF